MGNRLDLDFEGKKYYVRKPNRKESEQANYVYIREFRKVLDGLISSP